MKHDMSILSGYWTELSHTDAERFEVQLGRELTPGHRLYGAAVRAVAVRKLEKEVVFRMIDDDRWAWVHLTWSEQHRAEWPMVELHDDWASLVTALRSADRG